MKHDLRRLCSIHNLYQYSIIQKRNFFEWFIYKYAKFMYCTILILCMYVYCVCSSPSRRYFAALILAGWLLPRYANYLILNYAAFKHSIW